MSFTFPSVFDIGAYVFDDFATNDSVADAAVGKFKWEIDAISAGADTLTYETDQGETFLRMTGGGGGDGDGSSLSGKDDSWTVGTGGGYIRARVRIPDITGNQLAGNNFKIGLIDVVDGTEPTKGLWIDCDAGVLSIDAASANGDLNATMENVPTDVLTSGTTMILGTTYNLELRWSGDNGNSDPGPNRLDFYVNGVFAAHIDNVLLDGAETVEPNITHVCDTGGASTLELDVFGVEFCSFVEGK